MIKLLLYTALFGVGSYFLVTNLPDSVKDKMAAAVGLGGIKSKTIEIFNPAAKRAELLDKLEENIYQIQSTSNTKTGGSAGGLGKTINIDGQPETAPTQPLLEESQELITEIKTLNPKTGVLPSIVGKIFGIDNPPPANTVNLNQLTPEQKAEVCK